MSFDLFFMTREVALDQPPKGDSTGALALVAAKEGRTDDAMTLSDEARTRASASDLLTFRGEILEEAAIVRRLARDSAGEIAALEEAFVLYERKGNIVGAERVRSALQQGVL